MQLKTKQERKDTPLAETPDPTQPITDLKSALSDINNRNITRQATINASNAKLNAARIARSKEKKSVAGGTLYGLASFASTTEK